MRILNSFDVLLQSSHAEAAKASLEAQKPDREAWKRLCKEFLKGKLFSTQYIVEEAQIRSRLGWFPQFVHKHFSEGSAGERIIWFIIG